MSKGACVFYTQMLGGKPCVYSPNSSLRVLSIVYEAF